MRSLFVAIISMVVLSVAFTADGKRTASDVKRERQATESKIKNTRKQIAGNVDQTRRELNNLTTLQGNMRRNDQRILSMRHSTDSVRRCTRRLRDSVRAMERRVDTLRARQASTLRAVRNHRQSAVSATAFIFSSGTFRQALRRASYMRDLARWQDSATRALQRGIVELDRRRERLDTAQAHLKLALDELAQERAELEQNTRQARAVVASLKRQGSRLEKVLTQQQQQADRLDKELNRIIEEEARRAAREEQQRRERERIEREKREKQKSDGATGKKTPVPAPTPKPEPMPSGADFASLKGKLPMPLDCPATVAVPFGVQSHSEYSKVKTQNNGIDFDTQPGANARAVCDGTVTMIIVMRGYHNVVLVRHGEYLTVYAGLDKVNVRKGQTIKAGEPVGSVYTDSSDSNRTRLHFEVRHEIEKLDPSQWLR